MTSESIDHNTLAHLVESGAVRGARVVGQAGGWGVLVRHGKQERPLAASRSRQVRLFKKLETVATYLRDIGLVRFDVDAAAYDAATVSTVRRPDRSAALKRAHEAAAHDAWFRAQVDVAIAEADDPATPWVSDEDARASWAKKRAKLVKRAGTSA